VRRGRVGTAYGRRVVVTLGGVVGESGREKSALLLKCETRKGTSVAMCRARREECSLGLCVGLGLGGLPLECGIDLRVPSGKLFSVGRVKARGIETGISVHWCKRHAQVMLQVTMHGETDGWSKRHCGSCRRLRRRSGLEAEDIVRAESVIIAIITIAHISAAHAALHLHHGIRRAFLLAFLGIFFLERNKRQELGIAHGFVNRREASPFAPSMPT
jgi:hypothetical protein